MMKNKAGGTLCFSNSKEMGMCFEQKSKRVLVFFNLFSEKGYV